MSRHRTVRLAVTVPPDWSTLQRLEPLALVSIRSLCVDRDLLVRVSVRILPKRRTPRCPRKT